MRRPRRTEVLDSEFDGIRAGLLGEACPRGSNPFMHLAALYPTGSRSVLWPRIVAVYRALPKSERRQVRSRRRVAAAT